MGKPLSKVKRGYDDKKWEDDIEWFDFLDGKQHMIRIVGDVEIMARHWIETLSNKVFPQWCPAFDEEEEEFDDTRPCPAHDDFSDKAQKVLLGNAIIRSLQDRGDDNPVRGFNLPHAVNDDLLDIAEMIKVDPADPKKGIDLAIKYNKKAKGNKKWSVQRGDRTPLTEEELEYDYYNFPKIKPDFTDADVQQEYALKMKEGMARNKHYVTPTGRVPDDARNPFKYFKGDAKGKPWNEFQELVDFKSDDDDKGSTDTAVSKKKKKGNKTKDDDGAEDEIDDDEDEDEEPVSKKKKKKDPEPDDDDGGDDDEDDEPPPKKKKKKDPEPDDDDDDEDDDPPPKKKKKPVDDDDDDEDEKPPKKDKGGDNEHPDPDIESKKHPKLGLIPECFTEYNAKAKCSRCPVRAKCIDETDDDDDL